MLPPRGARPLDGLLFTLDLLNARPRRQNVAAIRRLCHAVPVSGDAVLCRVLGRYKMYVDPADDGLSPHLILDGYWEIWVTEAIARLVRPGMAAVDVGANLGYFTLLLADLVGPAGSVHAVEPNPRMAALLARSVRVNGFGGRVQLHKVPAGAEAGASVVLDVPDGLPQNGRTTAAGGSRIPGAMLTTTLDALVGDGPVDVIKIDAEGAELGIWQGMAGILARRQPLTVFMEFTPDRYPDPAGFLDEMRQAGFSLSVLDPKRGPEALDAASVLAQPDHEDQMLVLRR